MGPSFDGSRQYARYRHRFSGAQGAGGEDERMITGTIVFIVGFVIGTTIGYWFLGEH